MVGFETGYVAMVLMMIVAAGIATMLLTAFTVVHSGNRRCSVCHKDFKGEDAFREHADTHTGGAGIHQAA